MELDRDAFRAALTAYYDDRGTVEDGIHTAIKTYLAEMGTPVQTPEALPMPPQRDYRKELWVEVYLKSSDTPSTRANTAVGAFDNFFEDKP